MNNTDRLLIGITGQTGAGKTTISSLLINYGFKVIDADAISRKVVELGKPALNDLKRIFGKCIINIDGTLNRPALAKIVFNKIEEKEKLESVLFPYIKNEIEEQVFEYLKNNQRYIFLDAPTLFESGINVICDKVISVIAPKEIRYNRVSSRDKITNDQINERMSSQHDDYYYTSKSDFIINNNSTMNNLEKQLLDILTILDLSKYIN